MSSLTEGRHGTITVLQSERGAAALMKDYQAQIEKLRKDAAECALIRDLATDTAKREIFDRLAKHLNVLADQVEKAMIGKNDMGPA